MLKQILATGAVVTMTIVGFSGVVASADNGGQDKVTICHAAGQAGTTHFNTLTIGYNAVYGPAGHFYENGTPRAGHEQDYLGACKEDIPTEPTETVTQPTEQPTEPTETVTQPTEPTETTTEPTDNPTETLTPVTEPPVVDECDLGGCEHESPEPGSDPETSSTKETKCSPKKCVVITTDSTGKVINKSVVTYGQVNEEGM